MATKISELTDEAESPPDISGGKVRRKVLNWHLLFYAISAFLIIYGLFNFAELPFGWKNRVPQVSHDLGAAFGLGHQWVLPMLWLTKSFEGILGLVALFALARRSTIVLVAAILGWMAEFAVFGAIDVMSADRSELLEHTSYFVGFTQLLGIIIVVSMIPQVSAWLARVESMAKPGAQ